MELDGLGVTPAEQRLYESLLGRREHTLAELTGLTGLAASRLRVLLKALVDKGLLTRTEHRPARFTPAPPDIAVEVLALRREQQIAGARLAGLAFCDRVRPRVPPVTDSPVEVVRGRAAVAHRFRQLHHLARRELLILAKPPYVAEPDGAQQGVRYRTIYDRDALDPAEKPRQLAERGAEARVLTGVPMKLVIADRRVGLAPHELPGVTETAILIRAGALLDGLVTLFETLWDQAAPLWPHHPLTTRDDQLLALLAAGLTDQAIARKLGVALRTVERRVRRMMDTLGARTRFQAGLQAATRGQLTTLTPDPDPNRPQHQFAHPQRIPHRSRGATPSPFYRL